MSGRPEFLQRRRNFDGRDRLRYELGVSDDYEVYRGLCPKIWFVVKTIAPTAFFLISITAVIEKFVIRVQDQVA